MVFLLSVIIVMTMFSAKKGSGLQFNRRRMQRKSGTIPRVFSVRVEIGVKKGCRSKRRVDRLSYCNIMLQVI